MATANGERVWERAWDILMKIAVPVSFLAGATLIAHEVRLGRIESNRFTDADGADMERRVHQWVEDRYPPQWLREQLKAIAAQTALIPVVDARLEDLNDRVKKLENR